MVRKQYKNKFQVLEWKNLEQKLLQLWFGWCLDFLNTILPCFRKIYLDFIALNGVQIFLTPSCYVLGKIFWIFFQLLEKNKALENVPWLHLVSKVTLLYLCCCYQNEMIVVNLLFWRVATLNEVQLISCLQISCTSSPLFR